MTPTYQQIKKWMSTERKGKGPACEHFGITKSELWEIMNASRAQAEAGGGAGASAVAPERLGPLAWRESKLNQIEEVIDACVDVDHPNAAGIAALVKSALKLRGEIDTLAALKPKDLEDATPEEVSAYLELHMDAWEDVHLEQAMRLYSERHGGRVLFIGDGGHRTQLEEDGWRVVNSS